jgi:salicylate hydroxylase
VLGKTTSPQPAKHNNCCYRFLIPRADLEKDPETVYFNQGKLGCKIYADPEHNRRIVTYTCREYASVIPIVIKSYPLKIDANEN